MENNYEKYLSLKTAAQLYGYTRDHLGLMIRRGKLTGTKLGNYYVTTDNWMVEYIKKYADQNHPANKNKLSNKFLADIFLAEKKSEAPTRVVSENKASAILYKNNIADNIKNDIKSEILKDLDIYNLPSGFSNRIKNSEVRLSSAEDRLLMSSDMLYTILPTRKMEDAERKSILKKLES